MIIFENPETEKPTKYAISDQYSLIYTDKLYKWDNIDCDKSQLIMLYEISLNPKIKSIACNNEIAHIITEDGLLYSWGEDSKEVGILGLGYSFKVTEPIINSNLLNKRITNIALSEKHCCCIDSNQYITLAYNLIYTWGTGLSGELFQGDSCKSLIPFQIDGKKVKASHVSKLLCGLNYTIFLNCNNC